MVALGPAREGGGDALYKWTRNYRHNPEVVRLTTFPDDGTVPRPGRWVIDTSDRAVVGRDDAKFDAIVVGAGFSGLRMLHELRTLGKSAIILEAAPDVGGTWFWNRYPGARTDVESWQYCFSFSKDLQDEWTWTERYASQPEVLRYLRYVADRFGLRRDIEFNTRVRSAVFNEHRNTWTVTTDAGRTYRGKYFFSASGGLSEPYLPDFPGVESFRGTSLISSRWPDEEIDFAGKRVAIVGTGSTGVQLVPVIAQTAERVMVFQRTPNFVLPARNYPLSSYHMQAIRADYDNIWRKVRQQSFGLALDNIDRPMSSVSEEEASAILEWAWETGGFRYLFETFSDVYTSEEVNEAVADFVRQKIRAIVHDAETAEALCPTGYAIGGKRPPLGHQYYEAFNRPNVALVDVRQDPISEITPKGLRTTGREFECDVIIYATGFDAGTGALLAMDVRGRNGLALREAWADGPRTYLGLAVNGFPNFLMIYGPQSVYGNVPVVVELSVEWISKALAYMDEHGFDVIEPTGDAEIRSMERLNASLHATVLAKGQAATAWYFGTNIPGKAAAPMFDFTGVDAYLTLIDRVAADGFDGFVLSSATDTGVTDAATIATGTPGAD